MARTPSVKLLPKAKRQRVHGHPVMARDPIEYNTLARDLVWADYFGIHSEEKDDWLIARSTSRRDLLSLCNNILGLTRLTEAIHRPASNFIMSILTAPKYGFGSYRDSRGNGKTSLATRGGTFWVLAQDPIECIERGWAILGRESRLGINTLRSEITEAFIQMILDDLDNPDLRAVFPELYPEVKKRWGVTKGIDLRRGLPAEIKSHPLFAGYPPMTRFLDPTIAPGSLEAGRAGAHTHGEFVDDPVNEKTWNSPPNITRAVHGINQLFSIVRPERGFRLVIGNYWCPDDVNSRLDETSNWRIFQRSATACGECKDGYPTDRFGKIPLLPNKRPEHQHIGTTWTHLMPESDGKPPDLGLIKQGCGSIHIFMAQYENDPVATEATYWQSSRLPTYEVVEFHGSSHLSLDTLVKFPDPKARDKPIEDQFMACRIRDTFRTLAFDPHHGSSESEGASEGAITVLGRTPADNFLWLSAIARQGDPYSMLELLVEEVIKWRVQRIVVESVGYQKIIGGLLRREFESRKVNWLNWDEDIIPISISKADGPKRDRIREGLNPLFNSGLILVSPHMEGYTFAMLQVDGFPIRKPWDTLDSMTLHQHAWEHVPITPARRRQLRLAEILRRHKMKRETGIAYGWGSSKRT